MSYFEKQYELRYFEMNKFGDATATAISTLLEETAAEHCLEIGYSLYDLKRKNIGWVLISGAIEMDRYPRYKEKITIRTWLSGYSLVKGYRENIILDETGNILGKARGMWVFYDIKKRRPIAIPEDIKKKWPAISEKSSEMDLDKKLINPNSKVPLVEFNVYNLDIDGNNHVNNIKYLHWLIESLPRHLMDNYFLKSLNCRFLSEVYYGDTIRVFIEEGDVPNTFFHSVNSKQGEKICANAVTVWEKRK